MSASGLDEITDDYVTELLKRDAQTSARSLSSLLNRRPQSSAPKPNTRFLRNILRDTDNHNAALLAKEAQESQERLNKLRQSQRPERPAQQLYSARDRHDSKRRRLEPVAPRAIPSSSGRRRTSPSPSAHRRHRHSPERRDADARSARRSRSPDRQTSRRHDRERRSSRSRHRDSRKRRTHSRHRSSSPEDHSRSHKSSRRIDDHDRSSKRKAIPESNASDSDPLEAIIGPSPPPSHAPIRSRGRGVLSKASAIDDHFASNYDPSADVQLETHQDQDLDWDQALDALRDRQKWKQQGADRLRAAGFSENDVKRWEKGGERTEEDVVWRKRGEGREWDRGKVLDDEGGVDVKPEWGRLKDS